MRIAVMGAGGIGGYFGARLAAAGHDVAFIARGAHLEAMRAHGLQVKSALGDLHLKDVVATDDPASLAPVEIVLFAVKLWDVEAAGEMCRPLLKPGSGIVALQNGVDAEERLSDLLGAAHVIAGTAQISALIKAPGVISHRGAFASMQFGELDNARSARVEALLAACRDAAIEAEIPDDIRRAKWQKFILLAPFAGMTAVTRKPIGAVRGDPDTRAMFRAAIAEAVAVARASGVGFSDKAPDKILAICDGFPPAMTASMAEDLARGNRLELPWLTGAIVRIGREKGVPTPVNAFINTALKLWQEGRN
jgi:2-dehydropantoate 2-reductase